MAKALIYFASTLMLLLAVSIITNAFVFGKSIATNCGDFTDMRANKPDAVAVTIDTQVNEELTSKLISSAAPTTTTTTKASTTSTTSTSTTRWYTATRTVDGAFWGSDSSDSAEFDLVSDDSGWNLPSLGPPVWGRLSARLKTKIKTQST